MALKVVITAGGPVPHDLKAASEHGSKAMLRVGDSALVEIALRAVSALNEVSEVAIVGGTGLPLRFPAETRLLGAEGSVIDNLVRGFKALGGPAHDYLVLSADLPFVTTEALAHFLERAHGQADLSVPLVTKQDFLRRFPGAANRFEFVEGQHLTMGSAFYFRGQTLHSNIPLMQDFARSRKSPLKLAVLLGFPVLWGFLTKSLRISALEHRASALTGGKVRAIPASPPELAFDVDNQADFDFAQLHQSQS